jgi:hypothetical protein
MPLNESERRQLLELFVEIESIHSLENPNARYETVLRHGLHTVAQRFGVDDLPDDILQQAIHLACSPRPFPDALSALNSLAQQDYTIVLLSPVDKQVLLSLIFDEHGEKPSPRLPLHILHTPSIYSPLPGKVLNDLTELATTLHPGILPSQIVAVTISVARTVEPCASRRIPTVFVRRQSTLESRLILDSSAPTLEVTDISELSALLEKIAGETVILSKAPDTPVAGT